jgi:SfnB family sulfur acquisition oxidoreductase
VRLITSDSEAIEAAEKFAARLAPGASQRDQSRELPLKELAELSRSGILGLTVPREYGGADVSARTMAQVFQIVASADPAIAQLPHSHFVFLNAIREDGTADQKQFFFNQILAGGRIANAQSERGSASALDLRTRVTKSPDPTIYRLNGTKYYCTGAIAADWLAVASIDDDGRLVVAYVPGVSSGVIIETDWNAMGQRVTFSSTATFTNVAVQEAHIVAHWRLFERPSLYHSFAQLLHTAIEVGIAKSALEDAVSALRARKRPRLAAPPIKPTEDPLILLRLGQLRARYHASESLMLRAADIFDAAAGNVTAKNAPEVSVAVSEAKAFSEDVVLEIANELFALIGTASTDESLNLNRHWRNARTHTAHDANQWRYHEVGNFLLNGVAPGKPLRKLVAH